MYLIDISQEITMRTLWLLGCVSAFLSKQFPHYRLITVSHTSYRSTYRILNTFTKIWNTSHRHLTTKGISETGIKQVLTDSDYYY